MLAFIIQVEIRSISKAITIIMNICFIVVEVVIIIPTVRATNVVIVIVRPVFIAFFVLCVKVPTFLLSSLVVNKISVSIE